MRKNHSHEVVPVDDCLIAHPDASEPSSGVVVTERVDTAHGTREYAVAGDGFWQVHPGAPRVLVEAVLDLLRPQPGERALDLYAGVGLFAGFLLDAVGPDLVVTVEGDRTACRHARANLGPAVRVLHGDVDRVLAADDSLAADLVVLDPPREGARRPVVEQVVARTSPRRGLRRLRPRGAGPGRGGLRRARLPADRPARVRPVPDDPPRGVRRAAGARLTEIGYEGPMASYSVNKAAVAHARDLIEKKQYVLDSDWGEVQPSAETRTPSSSGTPGRSTPPGTSASPRAPTTRPRPATRSCAVTSAGCTARR